MNSITIILLSLGLYLVLILDMMKNTPSPKLKNFNLDDHHSFKQYLFFYIPVFITLEIIYNLFKTIL